MKLGTSEVDARPNRDEFMDTDMLRLWRRMGPLPGSLRLYGGTAMALYRNHRESTDFDFATPAAEVDQQLVAALPWMAQAKIVGGAGMVDATIKGENRKITVTFMECGTMVPMPTLTPLVAPNGVAVAHPVDLVASKVEACFNRGSIKDYRDVAEAAMAWPEWSAAAARGMESRPPAAVGRVLATPPASVARELQRNERRALRELARSLGNDKKLGR